MRILHSDPRRPENCYLRVHFHKLLQASPAEVTKIPKRIHFCFWSLLREYFTLKPPGNFPFFFNPSADEPGGKPESAMARGQKLFLPGTLLPVKNTFITEAETIHAGTTDIAQQAGEHTEKQFVKTEARQRRTPGAKRVQAPP